MAFQIRDNKVETENKTIRFPVTLINKIEDELKEKNVSFSKFVIQVCEYALDNMETTKKREKN